MDEYRETNLDMESAVPLTLIPTQPAPAGIAIRTVPAELEMASLVQPMSFCDMPLHVSSLLVWVERNGYALAGSVRELHLFGSPRLAEQGARVMMELQVPVRPR